MSHNRMCKTLPPYLAEKVSQMTRKQETFDDSAALTKGQLYYKLHKFKLNNHSE